MKVLVKNQNDIEKITVYCERISKKNNSILYKLEDYLGEKLLSNDKLKDIRDCILSISADIKSIPEKVIISEGDE